MIYGSLCSGIEAATQAWHPLGWKPAFFSEIERFPSAVLAHHYPDIPNHGDMTKFKDWPDHAIDILVGGTPCQSFSVAGLRKGLADPRGNLMLTFGAVAQRFRPRWLVWENVPGVLSSDGGRDFGTFLGMLAELGYGFAYRVLDAQYVRTRGHAWAVPQRRRRVFVVGYFGDWRRAAAVLFDGESLSGNPAPRRGAGQGIAISPNLRAQSQSSHRLDAEAFVPVANSGDVGYCLTSSGQQSLDAETETLVAVAHTLRGEGCDASEDGTGRGTPIVPVAIQERATCENPDAGPGGVGARQDGAAYTLEARPVPQAVAFSFKDYGNDAADGISPTLRSLGAYGENGGSQMAIAYRTAGDGAVYDEGDSTAPLTTATDPNAQIVAFDMRGREGGAQLEGPHDTANIRAADGGSSRSYVAIPWAVRRLTPRECERLQAFPDDFTRIPYRGKPAEQCPDGPRYKALGNSMAVNVMEWIGERIQIVEAAHG